jgi:hypothetical protein
MPRRGAGFDVTALIAEVGPLSAEPDGFCWVLLSDRDIEAIDPAWARASMRSWARERPARGQPVSDRRRGAGHDPAEMDRHTRALLVLRRRRRLERDLADPARRAQRACARPDTSSGPARPQAGVTRLVCTCRKGRFRMPGGAVDDPDGDAAEARQP